MALTQISSNGVKDGSIVNADVKSDAAIALSKLASTPAVLTGSTDNTVCTVTGANAITGESNVHINGGILVVGHTASTTTSNGEGPFVQVKAPDSRAGASFIRHSADAAGSGLYIGKSRNATIGSNTVVQDDDELGRITFSGDDGTDINTVGAEIAAHVDGTPGSNDMPARLTFRTTADGAASTTERMRITSEGKVGIGIASPTGIFAVSDGTRTAEINPHSDGTYIGNRTNHPVLFQVNASEKGRITTGGDLCWGCTSTTSLGTQTGYDNVSTFNQAGITLTAYGVTTGLYYDRLNYTNSQYYIVNESGVGVYLGDGNTSWTAHSDERLKKDIVELDGTKAWNHVKAAKAASFKWNVAGYPTDTRIGFIAQDWETNYPEVIKTTDETIGDVSNPKGIQYTETIPVLMAALKQAITEIETLKTKVAALESA